MIHKIEIEVPDGWVPVGFGYAKFGEHILEKMGKVVEWDLPYESYAAFIKVEREIWEPKDGEEVWTVSTLHGAVKLTFNADDRYFIESYENNFIFSSREQAQEAYEEFLKLMKKRKIGR